MNNTTKYSLPTNPNAQLEYIFYMIYDIEENSSNELSFNVDRMFNNKYHMEVFECGEDIDDDKEVVDWGTFDNLESLFDYLMEQYL